MGSGKHLRRAIEKHGIENFTKEILFVFDTETAMNDKEIELVTEEFCSRTDTYNLCVGGKGGWSYIHREGKHILGRENANKNGALEKAKIALSKKSKQEISERAKKAAKTIKEKYGGPYWLMGKSHTTESKRKIGEANSISQKGSRNSQFGTHWITNGKENRKIKFIDMIPPGWYKGRTL